MTKIQQALKDGAQCSDDLGVKFRNSYSGRAMYGKSCVGLVGSHEYCMKVVGFAIEDLAQTLLDSDEPDFYEFGQCVDALMRFRTDSMGFDVILYWPDLESLPDENEDD